MNNLLELKREFLYGANVAGGEVSLKKGQEVTVKHLENLAENLRTIYKYWQQHPEIDGALVSAHYHRVIPKSDRLKILLSPNSQAPNKYIVGAKFETLMFDSQKRKHVFTYFVPLEALEKSINLLSLCAQIVNDKYGGLFGYTEMEELKKNNDFRYKKISKTAFKKVMIDSCNISNFQIDKAHKLIHEPCIVTIYKTKLPTIKLLEKFGIHVNEDKIIDELTIHMMPEELQVLMEKAPYLVSMGVKDINEYEITHEINSYDEDEKIIPLPHNEPVIGVIDTPFNKNVYFHEWVQYENWLKKDIPLDEKDFRHGTAVSSIIVDGPKGNPELDDGCGRFRVKHFGVATSGRFSSFLILQTIKKIIQQNQDIKVWNLSLGSNLEINENFISPEAAILDKLQNEYDVIFVIAGTNLPSKHTRDELYRIGAPADSLNSIVVNSVNFKDQSASYSRSGPVLSFFVKPDVSYYGGDSQEKEYIKVCTNPLGASSCDGTSFAAPWITRKLAYLIYVMGFSREAAKALLIDSAIGWHNEADLKKGHGVVPISINKILNSPEDEIKFVISGMAKGFSTYTYQLPVPIVNNQFPYIAKAVLTYFPVCDRNQGVDYPDTELDLHFGRIKLDKNHKQKMVPLNGNMQSENGIHAIYEEEARNEFRKWDNVKIISDQVKQKVRARKVYETGMWGIKIFCKHRLSTDQQPEVPFGLVVTLKEIEGKNRIDEFKQLCQIKGWLVNEVNVENRVTVYLKGEEEVKLD